MDLRLIPDRPVGHPVEHGMARSVGSVAGTPFLGPTEIPGIDEAVGLLFLHDGGTLGVDDHLPGAFADPGPGDPPLRQLAGRLGGGGDEHPRHHLVTTPVAPLDGVGKMDIFVVPLSHDGIGQARLHPALGRSRMGALDRYEGEDDGIEPLLLSLDRDPQSRQAAPDHQGITVADLHCSPPAEICDWGM